MLALVVLAVVAAFAILVSAAVRPHAPAVELTPPPASGVGLFVGEALIDVAEVEAGPLVLTLTDACPGWAGATGSLPGCP